MMSLNPGTVMALFLNGFRFVTHFVCFMSGKKSNSSLLCLNRPTGVSGVRMKAPSVKEVLDISKDNLTDKPEPLRITAPPLHAPSR